MKSLTLIFTLIFSVMFSSTSFAEWTKVDENVIGTTNYVDFDRIRKVDGFVYYWTLSDLLKPDEDGDLSYKHYRQGDCKLFRYKVLSGSYYKEPMGGGTGKTPPIPKRHQGWKYPPPNSSSEIILKKVCSR
jgi:hypothetical protein